MSVTYALYESESREFIELGKRIWGDGPNCRPTRFQRPAASIAKFVAERAVGDGVTFFIHPDTQDQPEGEWQEVMAEEWPGSESDRE